MVAATVLALAQISEAASAGPTANVVDADVSLGRRKHFRTSSYPSPVGNHHDQRNKDQRNDHDQRRHRMYFEP